MTILLGALVRLLGPDGLPHSRVEEHLKANGQLSAAVSWTTVTLCVPERSTAHFKRKAI